MCLRHSNNSQMMCFSYLDTAQCFEKEVGSNINKYDVCDNIDLTTILQVRILCV